MPKPKKKQLSKTKKTTKKEFRLPLMEIEDYEKLLKTDIFKLLGLEKLPDSKKEAMAFKINRIIEDRVLMKLDLKLKGLEIAQLKHLLDQNQKEEFFQFLKDKSINLGEMVVKEAIILKSQIVNFVKLKTKQK